MHKQSSERDGEEKERASVARTQRSRLVLVSRPADSSRKIYGLREVSGSILFSAILGKFTAYLLRRHLEVALT